jgi:hypothetical protein
MNTRQILIVLTGFGLLACSSIARISIPTVDITERQSYGWRSEFIQKMRSMK